MAFATAQQMTQLAQDSHGLAAGIEPIAGGPGRAQELRYRSHGLGSFFDEPHRHMTFYISAELHKSVLSLREPFF